jgi:hypothetical protein
MILTPFRKSMGQTPRALASYQNKTCPSPGKKGIEPRSRTMGKKIGPEEAPSGRLKELG